MDEYHKEHKAIRVGKRIGLTIGFTLLLALLGLFSNLGYHVYSLKQVSFVKHSQLGYADATVECDILYNPLLYPFYWFTPNMTGRQSGVFVITYYPETYGSGDSARPRWGYRPEDRYENYMTTLTSWGFYPNLLILCFFPFMIEIARSRLLYLIIIFGVGGFAVATLVGMGVGLVTGLGIFLFLRFRVPSDNILARFWSSLWE
ncbi:hypothetical protein MUP01_03530 [Candidatus Bathyarchaeota archaeon]|nr:hypothetical protein [Candidatus Bathyarchaeota archaeon]